VADPDVEAEAGSASRARSGVNRPRRGLRALRRRPGYAAVEAPLLGFAIWCVLRFLRAVTRLEIVDAEPLAERWRTRSPVVLAFWHGRSIMLPFLYRGPGVRIMNSTHRDGEIITRALERFGIRSTRGSSSRTAVAGTLGLARALRAGSDVALIPDGPRGPAGVAKPGAVALAAAGNTQLFPLAFSASRAVRMKGWDRMMLPLPGARVVCVIGSPIDPPKGACTREERERLRALLEQRLHDTTRRADRLAGRYEEDR
jgi:hypothetical protein